MDGDPSGTPREHIFVGSKAPWHKITDTLGTGHPITIRGMTWLRLSNGRIVEGWDAWNQGRLMNDLQTAMKI